MNVCAWNFFANMSTFSKTKYIAHFIIVTHNNQGWEAEFNNVKGIALLILSVMLFIWKRRSSFGYLNKPDKCQACTWNVSMIWTVFVNIFKFLSRKPIRICDELIRTSFDLLKINYYLFHIFWVSSYRFMFMATHI